MKSATTVVLKGALPVSFAICLLASGSAAASQPDSSPAEQTQTQQLNRDVADTNAASDAQSAENSAMNKAQQDRYQEQLRTYRAGQKNYEERAAAYLAARDRYVASHARYHRAVWPLHADQRAIVDTADLLGADVHAADGRRVGHVDELALVSGTVAAVRVTLDNDKGDAWIETADLKFNAAKRVVITDLQRADLYDMAQASY